MSNKILVVVDYQHDFVDPNGTLYVNGADKIKDNIKNIIPDFDHVIFTLDSHPLTHCSFVENGGQWPIHCVCGTVGAGLPVEFIKASKSYELYYKGMESDEEEYGAFADALDLGLCIDHVNDFVHFDFDEPMIESLDAVFNSDYTLTVCGVAGDYCVLETLKNIIKYINKDKVNVYLDGIVSIDGGEKLNNYIAENNIKTY